MVTSTSAARVLPPQLADIARQLDDASRRAEAVAAGLTADELARRPAPESWSVAEAIEHLNLTSRAYLPLLDGAIEEARAKGLAGEGPFKMEMAARILNWFLEPPARVRIKTSAPFQPVEVADPLRVVPDFVALQGEVRRRLEASAGLAVDRVKVVSPFSDRVKYNLYAAFALIAVHERRHLWQAERARRKVTSNE